jgi:hypothetical protein
MSARKGKADLTVASVEVRKMTQGGTLVCQVGIRLRRTLHSDLNRLPATDCLWCAYAAPLVPINRHRPIAVVRRRAGCAA